MGNYSYTVFIISHGSPSVCKTLDVLKSMNFNSEYFIVIDDEDSSIEEYKSNYNNLLIFEKRKYIEETETIMHPKNSCSAVYVKNFIEDYCQLNHIKAFIIIDDDMKKLRYRYLENDKLKSCDIININSIFSEYVKYMIESDIDGLCFGMHTMYMNKVLEPNRRRFMSNIYFRNGKRKLNWVSQIYDDLNTCVYYSNYGHVYLMLPQIQMEFEPQYFQIQNMNKNNFKNGGLTDLYNGYDSFKRAFLTTIIQPSSAKPFLHKNVFLMSLSNDNTFPKIISHNYKK